MDTKKLRVVIDSINLGSFSKAAQKHLYTASAIIYMADSVEAELGIRIIERDSFGIKLTPEGKRLLPRLTELCRMEEDIKKEACELKSKRSMITIGCYPSVCKTLIPSLLIRLRRELHDIEISVIVKDNIREMAEHGADIFLVTKGECKERDYVPFYTDRYVAVTNQKLFSGKESVTYSDLAEHPFIMPYDSTAMKLFSSLPCEIIRIRADDDSAIIEMVKEGIGNTVLSELSAKGSDGVRLIKLEPEIKRELVITSEKNTSAVKRVMRVIADIG